MNYPLGYSSALEGIPDSKRIQQKEHEQATEKFIASLPQNIPVGLVITDGDVTATHHGNGKWTVRHKRLNGGSTFYAYGDESKIRLIVSKHARIALTRYGMRDTRKKKKV